jgi:hypothetical protein
VQFTLLWRGLLKTVAVLYVECSEMTFKVKEYLGFLSEPLKFCVFKRDSKHTYTFLEDLYFGTV